jgi:hypothetical protein
LSNGPEETRGRFNFGEGNQIDNPAYVYLEGWHTHKRKIKNGAAKR